MSSGFRSIDGEGGQALLAALSRSGQFSRPETAAILSVGNKVAQTYAAGRDLCLEGDTPRMVSLTLAGWCLQYKMLEDGRRQVLGIVLPGDMGNFGNFSLGRMDHSVAALTTVSVAEFRYEDLAGLGERYPSVARALIALQARALSIQREWTVNIGQRSSFERISHLFCEIYTRLRAVGMVDGQCFDLPLRQADIADATGVTPVHVNRILQHLRANGTISLSKRALDILDFTALQAAASFTPDYLFLD